MRGLFDSSEDVRIDKPIRMISLFAGYGSPEMALKRLGVKFEHHFMCEFDKYAVKSYNAVHGTNFETSDVRNIHGSDLNITDSDKYCYMLTYSFPCFTGETLVLTDNGLKQIKDVCEGESVISHDGAYHKIIAAKKTGTKQIWTVKSMASPEINCTENHPFYVRKMYRKYPVYQNGKRGAERHFSEPEWVRCDELTKNHYLGIAINQNSKMPDWDGVVFKWNDGRSDRLSKCIDVKNHSFWWLMGRYVGDGWVRQQGGIIICCANNEESEILVHVRNCGFNYSIVSEKTVKKIHIPIKELSEFVKCFGHGAENKHIPNFMFDMPVPYLESFIDGYVSADGWIRKDGLHKVSSISKNLIYGTAQLVAKVYKTPYKIYLNKRRPIVEIEGRICNQKSGYELVWKKEKRKQDKAFYEDGFIWCPVREVSKTEKIEDVFDIEVEESHSFTANGVIVHNCTDLSLAGKQAGMKKGSGTRSGLLWEVERILTELHTEGREKPQVLFMENVPQVCGEKNIDDFNDWVRFLESIGYHSFLQILNAKDYGVAQNRERAFMFSFLDDVYYEFPKPIELQKRVIDYLDEDVPEKYYVTSEKADKLLASLVDSGVLDKAAKAAS